MEVLQKVLCKTCRVPIWRSKGRINENAKLGQHFYCSIECISTARQRRKSLKCENEQCGRIFNRMISGISPHNYCSKSCAAIVNNRVFPKWKVGPRKCANVRCENIVKGWLKYCSAKCREGVRRRFTKQALLQNLRNIASTLGRVPAKREALQICYACVYYFGSWNNAVTEAGLAPNRSHSQRMYKRMSAKALDGHTCDSISEAIVDNWLTEHYISHQRDVRYPETNHLADWEIQKSVFIEYFGLARDSPRYDRAVRRKRRLCRRYGIRLIEIYPHDLYPKIVLDDKLKNLIYSPTS